MSHPAHSEKSVVAMTLAPARRRLPASDFPSPGGLDEIWREPGIDSPSPCQVVGLSPAALDALPGSVAFFDRCGRLVMANRSMSSALVAPAVIREVGHFKDSLIRQASISSRPENGRTSTREFVHRGRMQHLRGSYLSPEDLTPGPGFCITLHEGIRALPSANDLRCRFGLTNQEARVARLLAEGFSNEEIGIALSVSPHTARHHTEHVFSKMGVTSRSEVGWVMLRE